MASSSSSSPLTIVFNFKPKSTIKITAAAPSSILSRSSRATGIIRASGAEMKKVMYKGTQMREQRLTEMIEQKVAEAKQVCEQDETSDECKVAWDEVEEVSQAKADLRLKINHLQQDPLHYFCQENPETDECRIYED